MDDVIWFKFDWVIGKNNNDIGGRVLEPFLGADKSMEKVPEIDKWGSKIFMTVSYHPWFFCLHSKSLLLKECWPRKEGIPKPKQKFRVMEKKIRILETTRNVDSYRRLFTVQEQIFDFNKSFKMLKFRLESVQSIDQTSVNVKVFLIFLDLNPMVVSFNAISSSQSITYPHLSAQNMPSSFDVKYMAYSH